MIKFLLPQENASLFFFEGGKEQFIILIGGAVMREQIILACTECKMQNYSTMKEKKNTPDRLELNKYCASCKHHTLHKETK